MHSVLSLARIAEGVERTFVSYLQEYKSYNSVFIVGDVVLIHPHYAGAIDAPDTARIKITLREPETGEQFSTLIFGPISYDVFCNVNLKSRLALSGFRTEPNRGLDATLLLVLGREHNLRHRIWQVRRHTDDRVVACSSLVERFTLARRGDFYAVVRSTNNVDKKTNSVTIDIAEPSVASLTCRVKNCHAKITVFPAEPGDVLRVRDASLLLYSKTPTVVVACANVAVFKNSSLAAGGSVEAFSPGSNAKLQIQGQAESDTVLRLCKWNDLQQQKLRELEETVDNLKSKFILPEREPRPQDRLSCLAELRTVDVACVVAAVHRVWTPREHVFLTVWDGTVPEWVRGTQPPRPPDTAELIRRDDEAWRLLGPQLVSVSVARPWSRIAAALPLGAHVRLNGLTVRRNAGRNRWWVVLESRFSRHGLGVLARPCLELRESMEALLTLGNDSSMLMDATEQATTAENEKHLTNRKSESNVLQPQLDPLGEKLSLEIESEGELFSSCDTDVISDFSSVGSPPSSSKSLFGPTTEDDSS